LNLVFESWRQVAAFGGVNCGFGLATEYFVGTHLGRRLVML